MTERGIANWKGEWHRKEYSHRNEHRATHEIHAAVLEALLVHYPWIVYLGMSFWRKLMIRVWLPVDVSATPSLPPLTTLKIGSRGKNQDDDDDDDHDERSNCCGAVMMRTAKESRFSNEYTAEHLGVVGSLKGFSGSFVPPIFLEAKVPLSPTELALRREKNNQTKKKGKADDQVNNSGDEGGEEEQQTILQDFFTGLLWANQIDVVETMMLSLQFALPGALRVSLWMAPDSQVALRLLRKHGIEPNGEALVYAAYSGHLDAVKILIDEYKQDPNAKDDFQSTPLHSASEKGHFEIVKLLVEKYKASLDEEDDIGDTPLDKARESDVRCYLEECSRAK